ncbi:peptidylprolyl isomerase [Chlamydiia bacterium]|nr:peptidylprolyl isomerase [Chlamydiia bacterium]
MSTYEFPSNGVFAIMKTSKGEIILQLEYEKTPITVANFIGLADGRIKTDRTQEGEGFYNGIKFHRVIDDFMVQAGCPFGKGTGGPGYTFDDEINTDLKHDKPGVLSMANAGPGTNGSQFFITHIETPWLDGKHTVFGEVVSGMDVVNKIKQDDVIDTVSIKRTGVGRDFNALAVWKDYNAGKEQKQAKQKKQFDEKIASLEGYTTTESGLRYKLTNATDGGNRPNKGDTVSVHYSGSLFENGVEFDSSYKRGTPIEFPVGTGRVISGWDEGIMLLKKGQKATFIIPAHLGYGERGAGGVIPPNAILKFDVELVEIQPSKTN